MSCSGRAARRGRRSLTGGSGRLHLHGTIFPACAGAEVEIQRLIAGGARTVALTGLSPAGTYQANVATPGRYRIVYDGIDGPAISVTG